MREKKKDNQLLHEYDATRFLKEHIDVNRPVTRLIELKDYMDAIKIRIKSMSDILSSRNARVADSFKEEVLSNQKSRSNLEWLKKQMVIVQKRWIEEWKELYEIWGSPPHPIPPGIRVTEREKFPNSKLGKLQAKYHQPDKEGRKKNKKGGKKMAKKVVTEEFRRAASERMRRLWSEGKLKGRRKKDTKE